MSLINLNLEEEEKVLSGTFVSLSIWDDTMVLGSETVQCVNIKKWDWKLSFQATVSSDVSNITFLYSYIVMNKANNNRDHTKSMHVHACMYI